MKYENHWNLSACKHVPELPNPFISKYVQDIAVGFRVKAIVLCRKILLPSIDG